MWNLYLLRKFIEFRLTYKKTWSWDLNYTGKFMKKIKLLEGDGRSLWKKKKVQINACLILNGYRDKAVWINK